MIDSVVNSIEASSLSLNSIVLVVLGMKIRSYGWMFLSGAFLSFTAYTLQVFLLKNVEFINASILIIDVLVLIGVIISYCRNREENNMKDEEKSKL